jgi:hypothetical protein
VLERWRDLAASAAAAEPPERQADRLRARGRLLDQGEAALARGEVEAALGHFERAAQLLHAADTEMSLVRTYMQAGDYRRAVSFGAHTAGAHRQVVAGAVLYAWLLRQGGQEAVATQLLATAAQTEAPDPLLAQARRLLATPGALPSDELMAPPVRLAPYSRGAVPARGARVAGGAVLVGDGRLALAPRPALHGARAVWLRNGLGQTVKARRDPDLEALAPELRLAVLRLDAPLRTIPMPAPPTRDPFPGSPGCVVTFGPARDAMPGWPRLHLGFHGMPEARGPLRDLGIEVALPRSPQGGAVFDAAGRWVGIALPDADGRPRAAMLSALPPALWHRPDGAEAAGLPTPAPGHRAPLDEVYERALSITLQLILLA